MPRFSYWICFWRKSDKVSLRPEDAVAAVTAGLAAGAARHGVRAYTLLCAMRGQPAAACDTVEDSGCSWSTL